MVEGEVVGRGERSQGRKLMSLTVLVNVETLEVSMRNFFFHTFQYAGGFFQSKRRPISNSSKRNGNTREINGQE